MDKFIPKLPFSEASTADSINNSNRENIYDPSEVIHPGFVGQRVNGTISWPDERVKASRRSRNVDQYKVFLDFCGIDDTNKELLNILLQNIFNLTGNYWEPKLCQECALRMFNSITSFEVNLPPNYVAAWVYKINHSWIEIWIKELNEPVIFDPTGLDISQLSSRANMYTPYFGLRSKAPAHLASQYNYSNHIERIFSNHPDVAIERSTNSTTGVLTITEIPRGHSSSHLWDIKISGNFISSAPNHWIMSSSPKR